MDDCTLVLNTVTAANFICCFERTHDKIFSTVSRTILKTFDQSVLIAMSSILYPIIRIHVAIIILTPLTFSFSQYRLEPYPNSSFLEGAVEWPSVTSLGGFPSLQSRGRADMTGICLKHNCKTFVDTLKRGTCDAAFKCGGCAMTQKTANVDVMSQYCQNILPPIQTAIVLTTGYYRGDQIIKGSMRTARQETEGLNIEWAGKDVDVTHCIPDDFNEGQARMIMSNPKKPALLLHVRLVAVVSIMKIQQHLWNPDIELTVIYTPPREDLTIRGGYSGGGRCRQTAASIEIGPENTKLKNGELVNVVKSVTVPWDRKSITTENFEVRLKCTSRVRNCDLSNFRFCFRIMCTAMPAEIASKLLMLQELRLNPPELPPLPETPEELLSPLQLPPPPPPVYVPTLPPLPNLEEPKAPQLQQVQQPQFPPAQLPPSGQGRLQGHKGIAVVLSPKPSVVLAIVVLHFTVR